MITEEYVQMNKALHSKNPIYGVSSKHHHAYIRHLISEKKITAVLDYGCGKGILRQKLGPMVREYDPAVSGKDAAPEPAQLVCCIDVLEHIEPECLDAVLDHLRELTLEVLYLTVACYAAKKHLADGRNAHLIQKPPKWWLPKLMKRFNLESFQSKTKADGDRAFTALLT